MHLKYRIVEYVTGTFNILPILFKLQRRDIQLFRDFKYPTNWRTMGKSVQGGQLYSIYTPIQNP